MKQPCHLCPPDIPVMQVAAEQQLADWSRQGTAQDWLRMSARSSLLIITAGSKMMLQKPADLLVFIETGVFIAVHI